MEHEKKETGKTPEYQPKGRINRLIVSFDSGEVKYLIGDEAASFIASIDSAAGFTQLRYDSYISTPNWAWTDVDNASAIFQDSPATPEK